MNLMVIDKAITQYWPALDEGDKARLSLFRKLWGIVENTSRKAPAYTAPESSIAQSIVRSGESVFQRYPASIDASLFVETLENLLSILLKEGQYPASVSAEIGSVDWQRILDDADVSYAGKNPWGYLNTFADTLAACKTTEASVRITASMAFLALRAQLEIPAQKAVLALGANDMEHGHFLTCPVCGSSPMVARVGGENATDGRGKVLGCLQCGTSWDFERIRCARCGTRHQGHLHYFNLEGDDAHRLHTCDECGGYMRTVFLEESLTPFSFEVEDVIMAKLDVIAANPSLAQGKTSKAKH